MRALKEEMGMEAKVRFPSHPLPHDEWIAEGRFFYKKYVIKTLENKSEI